MAQEGSKSLALAGSRASRAGSGPVGSVTLVDALSRLPLRCRGKRSLRSYRPEIITALATDTDRVRRPRPEPALSLWCENRQPFT